MSNRRRQRTEQAQAASTPAVAVSMADKSDPKIMRAGHRVRHRHGVPRSRDPHHLPGRCAGLHRGSKPVRLPCRRGGGLVGLTDDDVLNGHARALVASKRRVAETGGGEASRWTSPMAPTGTSAGSTGSGLSRSGFDEWRWPRHPRRLGRCHPAEGGRGASSTWPSSNSRIARRICHSGGPQPRPPVGRRQSADLDEFRGRFIRGAFRRWRSRMTF